MDIFGFGISSAYLYRHKVLKFGPAIYPEASKKAGTQKQVGLSDYFTS